MSNCKPIAATPALSGEDARKIIAEALKEPSKEAVERLDRMWKATEAVIKR